MTTFTTKELLIDWLGRLPLVEAPVTLGEETHHAFTENSLPLPQLLTDAFILPYEKDAGMDEFTEYIPCFRLEHSGSHHVCVYWRANLMTYVYFLATFDSEGRQIDRALIAGTYMLDGLLAQRVAHISKEFLVVSAEGRATPGQRDFDLSGSVRTIIQISETGKLEYVTPSDL
jgi:hypothetical protein